MDQGTPTGRRARRRRRLEHRPALPSVTEVTIYTLLGAAVAGAVFVAGGRPIWHAALVVAGALLIALFVAVISRHGGHPTPLTEGDDRQSPTT